MLTEFRALHSNSLEEFSIFLDISDIDYVEELTTSSREAIRVTAMKLDIKKFKLPNDICLAVLKPKQNLDGSSTTRLIFMLEKPNTLVEKINKSRTV